VKILLVLAVLSSLAGVGYLAFEIRKGNDIGANTSTTFKYPPVLGKDQTRAVGDSVSGLLKPVFSCKTDDFAVETNTKAGGDGWVHSVSSYACVGLRHPASWKFTLAPNYSLPGQPYSLALYSGDENGEMGRPMFFLTPILDLDRVADLLGMSLAEIRLRKKSLGPAATEVYAFPIEKNDAYESGSLHEYYLVYAPVQGRAYVGEARFRTSEIANHDAPIVEAVLKSIVPL
jgi:hypothetical protein